MKLSRIALMLAVAASLAAAAAARPLNELARQAVSPDVRAANEAIRELRGLGYTGLDAITAEYSADIEAFKRTGQATERWKRIAHAIDTVAMQKDAYASGLFWHTDLETAKRAGGREGKPILTLRLLGGLNEEFSCANSRLFRSILYADPEVAKFLRENYVLHWRSVRPAPRITIDFGDGRKIERTVTGNSVHYVLNPRGQIIEALPGLYSPKAFLIYLRQADLVAKRIWDKPDKQAERGLLEYRKRSYVRLSERRGTAIAAADVELKDPAAGTVAIRAAPVAMTKMVVTDEITLLRVYDDFARFEPAIDLEGWHRLAKIYSPGQLLDAESIAFIRRQNINTGLSESDFEALFSKLAKFIALDTTRNDFLYHTKLYEWLNAEPSANVDEFNSRVYGEIFRTPDSDKWLGLYSTDIYTALDGNGLVRGTR